MCLSNVYENSVEQKNLILSNVQRIDCKDGFVVLYDLFERETRVEGRLATIDLVGNTAVIVFAYALLIWRNMKSCARCRTSAATTRCATCSLRRSRRTTRFHGCAAFSRGRTWS